jgi:hypothetical protein
MMLQLHVEEFPNIFKIVINYLLIQASAVLCERVFSSLAETDTSRQNHIKLILMEVLQIIKYCKKKECINFMLDWTETMEKVKIDEKMKGDIDGEGTSSEIADLLENSLEECLKAVMTALDHKDDLIDDM